MSKQEGYKIETIDEMDEKIKKNNRLMIEINLLRTKIEAYDRVIDMLKKLKDDVDSGEVVLGAGDINGE